MALKRVIESHCPHCGQQQAWQEPDGSVRLSHNCDQQPPGPPNPPKRFRADEVIFKPKEQPHVA